MKALLEQSGECMDLGKAEARASALAEGTIFRLTDSDMRAIIFETDADLGRLASRLAYSKTLSQHLFSGNIDNIVSRFATLKIPGKSFKVKVSRLDKTEKPALAVQATKEIGAVLAKTHRVDLKTPDIQFRVLLGKRCHAGLLVHETDKSAFEARKSEYRPFSFPISLHPKMARVLVNLTGVRQEEKLLDPFCGTGGILIEAAMVGAKPVGCDIDERMTSGSKKNLAHYGFRDVESHICDVSEIAGKIKQVDAIATDPPYGRSASTRKESISSLYKRAFQSISEVLKPGGKLAIVLPDMKHLELCCGSLKFLESYPVRVHRSLTRHFCVFEKQ